MTHFTDALDAAHAALPARFICYLVELDFPAGTVYITDAGVQVISGAKTYTPVGSLGSIDGLGEERAIIANGVTLNLSGANNAAVAALSTDTTWQGKPVRIYRAGIDPATGKPVTTPSLMWEGFMDSLRAEQGDQSGTIKLGCEHEQRLQPIRPRYTREWLQSVYPGDTGFDRLHLIPFAKANVGRRTVGFGGGTFIPDRPQTRDN